MPRMKWPLIWLTVSAILMVECFLDFTVDREEDAAAALTVFPFLLVGFALSVRYYRSRIAQRQQWREDREMAWWLSDLPPLPDPSEDIERTQAGWFARGGRVPGPDDPRTVGWKK